MRRRLIQTVLPLVFCAVPLLAAALIAAALPAGARDFYLSHLTPLDGLILGLGTVLFFVQMLGTFLTVVTQPQLLIVRGNPLILSTIGEFVLKNIVLIAAGLVIVSAVPKARSA